MSCCCNQVIYWNPTIYSSLTTGSDVSLNTSSSVLMPVGSMLPRLELDTDGSSLEIEIYGVLPNNSNRDIKVQIGSVTNSILSINGLLVDSGFITKLTVIRDAYNSGRWFSVTNYNANSVQHIDGTSYNGDWTTDLAIKFLINQSVASSIVISHIRITKFIK